MTTTVDSTQTSAKDGDTNKTETSGEQPVKQVDKSVILSTGSLPDGTKYHVRRMTFDDIEEVLKVWESIGLYEGTNSIQTFLTVDPEGFYVAINEKDGSILGSCAGVFVDPSVAFIGLYAVRPAYQGKGIGTNMFKQMLNHIGDKNVGLYAVPEQIETYRDKAGFRVEDTIKVLEYEGTQLKTDDLVTKISNIEIKNITEDEILKQKVINYDESVVNFDRASLLKLTFTEHGSLAMVAIDKDNGSIVGYGCIRTNNINRAMAGPIYASNDAVAELIVYNLITNLPVALSAGLDFMTPDCNPGGLRIAAKLGLKKNLDLPRFFTKSVPKVDWNRIYCIHTPNFSPY